MMEWRKIKNFENYSVSNDGKVRNDITGGVLKPCSSKLGYRYVNPSQNGEVKKLYVHRLVADAFIPNPHKKCQVNHINGVKTDNRVENLEWCTSRENHLHRSRTLGIKQDNEHMKKMGELAQKSHHKSVICLETGVIYESVVEAANAIKRSPTSLVATLKGRTKTCGGFTWKYNKEICLDE